MPKTVSTLLFRKRCFFALSVFYKLQQGLTVKILLLTNPHNPLGVVYKPNIIQDAITWARNRGKIHTIVDEIYALSIHKKETKTFQSVLRILDNDLGNDVHMLWAMSKDFGSSGFRVAVLCTQNEAFLRAFDNLNVFSGVSHPMQMMIAEILSDDDFVDSFLQYSSSALLKSYTLCTRKLNEMEIPFVAPEAGMFVYCDFSGLLPSPPTFEGEARLMKLMADVAHIVMTPGESQHDSKPGMFRICYAWNSLEILEVAMTRIKLLKELILKEGWSGLDEKKFSIDVL